MVQCYISKGLSGGSIYPISLSMNISGHRHLCFISKQHSVLLSDRNFSQQVSRTNRSIPHSLSALSRWTARTLKHFNFRSSFIILPIVLFDMPNWVANLLWPKGGDLTVFLVNLFCTKRIFLAVLAALSICLPFRASFCHSPRFLFVYNHENDTSACLTV